MGFKKAGAGWVSSRGSRSFKKGSQPRPVPLLLCATCVVFCVCVHIHGVVQSKASYAERLPRPHTASRPSPNTSPLQNRKQTSPLHPLLPRLVNAAHISGAAALRVRHMAWREPTPQPATTPAVLLSPPQQARTHQAQESPGVRVPVNLREPGQQHAHEQAKQVHLRCTQVGGWVGGLVWGAPSWWGELVWGETRSVHHISCRCVSWGRAMRGVGCVKKAATSCWRQAV